MKFKAGDKVRVKSNAIFGPDTYATYESAFMNLKHAGTLIIKNTVEHPSQPCVRLEGRPTVHSKNWVYPPRWFELAPAKPIKVGDLVTIDKAHKKEEHNFLLSEANWVLAKKSGSVRVKRIESKNSAQVGYIDFKGIEYYFPLSCMTRVGDCKKVEEPKKEAKMKFKVGDPVKFKKTSDVEDYGSNWTGRVLEVNPTKKHDLKKYHTPYRIRWEFKDGVPATCGTDFYNKKNLRLNDSVPVILKKKKEAKMKFKFKIGDKVKFKSTTCCRDSSAWVGKIIGINPTKKATSGKKGHVPYMVDWETRDGILRTESSPTYYNKRNLRLDVSPPVVISKKKKEKKKTMSFFSRKKKVLAKKKATKKKVAKKKVRRKSSKKKTSGYVVRALIKNGTAATAGICVGDTITNVAGKRIAARGSLGSALRGFKKGAKVSVTVTKPDGRVVHIHSVTLKANKAGRAIFGVISGKKKAAAYNIKLNAAKIKLAKSTKKTVSEVLEPTNEFEKRAAEEMKAVAALMADMKGRDALLKAKELRRDLHSELKKGTFRNADEVNVYLDKLRDEATNELAEPKSKRKLSRVGKFVFGLAGIGVLSGIASAIAYGITLL